MNYYNSSYEEVKKELGTDLQKGLTADEVKKRQEKYGKNELKEKKKKSIIARFFDQLKDVALIILIIAAIISAVISISSGEPITDTIVILVVIAINCILGVAQELKAEKSLEALKNLTDHMVKVIRDEKFYQISAKELVPGDILVLDTGDYIGADGRLCEAVNLKVAESQLTGESVPVEKQTLSLDGDVALADRSNMVYSSTLVTNGRAKVIVTKTGMNTEVGKIAQMLDDVDETKTRLQEKLGHLSKVLAIISVILCVIIFIIGVAQNKPIMDMLMTAISLAVAVIPESLVTISTIVLAIGVNEMAKKNAIIKSLPSVETLGTATYICSDKTGTLTQNKMTVTKVFFDNSTYDILELNSSEYRDNENKIVDKSLQMLINAMTLCNDTKIAEDKTLSGDPTETALVDMAFTLGYVASDFASPRIFEIPFTSERKLMSTVNILDDRIIVFTKGGIDEIFTKCNSVFINGQVITDKKEVLSYKEEAKKSNEQMATESLRVLACGFKVVKLPFLYNKNDKEKVIEYLEKNDDKLETNLCFIGLVGMIDPPRKEVKASIDKTKQAGIKTVMITGDHKATAVAIAKKLGILDDEKQALTGKDLDDLSDNELYENVKDYTVYSRVSPEHKVRIVDALQKQGEIVAMTGDGVNDSPALKKANIGCAMGKVGTDVAKQASDLILADDNFATIVNAVEEGRRIYDNIIKAIEFLLSSNIGETVCILLATLFLPLIASSFGISATEITILLPIQILLINLVTDSFPALGFAFMKADPDIMQRKPNKNKHIFTKGFTWRIIYQGAMIGIITFCAFLLGLKTDQTIGTMTLEQTKIAVGQTMAFICLAFSELVHVFNVVNSQKSIFKSNIGKNKQLILAVLASALIMCLVMFIPFMRNIFKIVLLPKTKLIETILLCISPIIIVEIFKLFKINGKRV